MRWGTTSGAPAPVVRSAPDPTNPDAQDEIEGIEISRLTELDPESVGVLDPEHGGFAGDLWRGTERHTVERLLPRLPGALGSATMREATTSSGVTSRPYITASGLRAPFMRMAAATSERASRFVP